MSSKNFMLEDFCPELHKAIVWDECPEISSPKWDTDLLKKVTGCENVTINVKHERTSTHIKMHPLILKCKCPTTLQRIILNQRE